MTIEEYKKQLEELDVLHKENQKELALKYLKQLNIYKKGDIIESRHNEKIKIERITFVVKDFFSGLPTIDYSGIKINKDGTLSKRNEIIRIGLDSIKK